MEILDQIRWNIEFIARETRNVDGSLDVKNEILKICNSINKKNLSETSLKEKEKLFNLIKEDIGKFDKLIQKIEESEENKILYMLLITHVADIKFLFLTPEEQSSLKRGMNSE